MRKKTPAAPAMRASAETISDGRSLGERDTTRAVAPTAAPWGIERQPRLIRGGPATPRSTFREPVQDGVHAEQRQAVADSYGGWRAPFDASSRKSMKGFGARSSRRPGRRPLPRHRRERPRPGRGGISGRSAAPCDRGAERGDARQVDAAARSRTERPRAWPGRPSRSTAGPSAGRRGRRRERRRGGGPPVEPADEEPADRRPDREGHGARDGEAAENGARRGGQPSAVARRRISSMAEGYPAGEVPIPIGPRREPAPAGSRRRPPTMPPARTMTMPTRNTRLGPNSSASRRRLAARWRSPGTGSSDQDRRAPDRDVHGRGDVHQGGGDHRAVDGVQG